MFACMDSINSFKSYSKFEAGADDEAAKAYRRQTRKRLAIISASALLLILIAVAAFVGTRVGGDLNRGAGSPQSPTLADATAVKAVCESTRYPANCVYTLLSANSSGERDDPEELLKLSLLASADELRRVTGLPATLLPNAAGDKLAEDAIRSCGELLGEAAGLVNRSFEAMAAPGKNGEILSPEKLDDLRTWLSGALTNHETCLDGLGEAGTVEIRGLMMATIKNSSELTSNSLAIATNMVPILKQLGLKLHRRLLMWVGPRHEVDGAGAGDGDGVEGDDVGWRRKPSMIRSDVGPAGSMILLEKSWKKIFVV